MTDITFRALKAEDTIFMVEKKKKTKEQKKTCGSRISGTGISSKWSAQTPQVTPDAAVFLLDLSSRNYSHVFL